MLTSKTLNGFVIQDPETKGPMLGQDESYDGTTGLMYVRVYPTKAMAEMAVTDMRRVNSDGSWNLQQFEVVPVSLVYQVDE